MKITRELWGKFPHFTFYGEHVQTYDRQIEAVKSGILPFDYSIYNAIASNSKASEYYKFLENMKKYPKGVVPISPISSMDIGFPLANWPTWMAQVLIGKI